MNTNVVIFFTSFTEDGISISLIQQTRYNRARSGSLGCLNPAVWPASWEKLLAMLVFDLFDPSVIQSRSIGDELAILEQKNILTSKSG